MASKCGGTFTATNSKENARKTYQEKKKEAIRIKNKTKTKLTRVGRMFKCRLCIVEGHNRLTCLKRKKLDVSCVTAFCNTY